MAEDNPRGLAEREEMLEEEKKLEKRKMVILFNLLLFY